MSKGLGFAQRGWAFRTFVALMALMLFYFALTLTVSKCCYRSVGGGKYEPHAKAASYFLAHFLSHRLSLLRFPLPFQLRLRR